MYTKIQVTFDAAEPEKLAEFWGLALGYVVEPPPEGFESWEDFAGSAGIPEADWGEVASRIDPAGEGPRLYFQRVPDKTRLSAKNTEQGSELERSDDERGKVPRGDSG
jgi:Glyoxalase-like domain